MSHNAFPATATGDGVLAGTVRVGGFCDYLRLAPSATVSSLVEVWRAPPDGQQSCTVSKALAPAVLYGRDAAAEG